jgi:hypothetical protein
MWQTLREVFTRIFRFPVAHGRVLVAKLPLLSQSDPGSGLCKADDASPLERILDAPEVWAGCWRPVVFSFPEANGSLIDPQLAGKTLLRQPGKDTRRAKLAAGDKI